MATGHLGRTAPRRASPHHRSAAYEYGRNINPRCRHQHTWHNLIAVRNEYKTIKSVSLNHALYRISNEFPAWQRVLHACMTLGNTITDSNGIELEGSATGATHTLLDRLSDVSQVNMPGRNFGKAIDHTDKWSGYIFLITPQGVQQSTGGRLPNTSFYHIASHLTSC